MANLLHIASWKNFTRQLVSFATVCFLPFYLSTMAYALAPDHQTNNISPATQNHKTTLIFRIEQSLPLFATGLTDKTADGFALALCKDFVADVGLNFHIAVLSFTDIFEEFKSDKINEEFTVIKVNKTYDSIYEKWFGIFSEKEIGSSDLLNIIPIALLFTGVLAYSFYRRRAERKQNELEKEATEEKLSAFYKLDLVGLTITSPDKGWVRVNDCLCKMLEYSEQELFSMTWAELTHPDDLAADVEQFTKLLANEIQGYGLEKRFISKSGKVIPTQLVVRCTRKDNGEVDYVMAMVNDISELKQAEASEAKRIFALDAAQIGDWDMDLTTNVAYRSLKHDQCFGYKTPERTWGYDTFLAHVHPEDRDRVDDNFKTALSGNHNYDVEYKAIWPDKTTHWLWSKGQFYFDASGKPTRVAGIVVDISSRKVAEEALQISSRALDAATNGICIADARLPDTPLVYVNPAFEKMTGYSASEVLGNNCRFLNIVDRDENKLADIRKAISGGIEIEQEIKNYRKDGSEFWIELKLSPVKDSMGQITHYVGIQRDVTEKKARIASIQHQAEHDSLTGLYNRRYFIEYADELIRKSTIHNQAFALICLDLDNFKRINDALGHAIGDLVLCQVANAISKVNLKNSVQIRLGGDEFVIICPDTDRAGISSALNEIHKQISKKITYKHLSISPTASFGVTFFPEDGKSANILLKNADLAMYTAKSNGRNCIEFFSPAMDVHAKSELTLENELNKALKNGDIYLEYQPQVDIKSGRLIGIEALARWKHKKLGQIPPIEFIRVAENSGLINKLGHYIMLLACRQSSVWLKAGVHHVNMAINVSAHQFRDVQFISQVKKALDETGLPAQKLELELTESILMRNTEDVLLKLKDLRAIGIKLSIDDFGTGYSSLSYLKNFPIDRLKIDRTFINNATENKSSAAIIKSIVMLGHNLGLEVIAEGVETKQQVVMLRKMKCDQAQGYFFSKPLSIAKFEAFCNTLTINNF